MFDRNLMKLSGMPAIMAALAILALLQAAAIAGQALSLSTAVASLWQGAPLDQAVPAIATFGGCFALLQLVRFGQETMLDRISQKQAASLLDQVLRKTFDSRTMLASRKGAAVVATTATEGTDEIQTYIRIIPPKVIGMVAISIPLLIVSFVLDWPSGIILAVMFPVIIFFMILLGKQARARAERQYDAYTRLSNRFLDTLRGIDVIKAFGAEQVEGESVFSFSEKLRLATVRTLTTATLSGAVLDLCATLGVAAVAMMLAFRLMDGSVALSTGLAALMLAPEYFTPIRSFASDFHASLDGKNALAAALEMIGDNDDTQADEDAVDDQRAQTPLHWSESSTLEFRNVGYHYDEGESGVHDISFTARGFESIAIVGKSGAGKSTLAKIAAGFIAPDEGVVLLDGNPIDCTAAAWKSLVRIIPQNPYIFRATLAENVRFYNPSATDEQVAAAIDAVGLSELVSELPYGLDTLVGEGARGLSGGQAHRIALARILLDEGTRVLVFDEPTAHLDIETEIDLKERMLPLMEGKLVLFATHRLHWTHDMDRTIEMKDGTVISDADVAHKPDALGAIDSLEAREDASAASLQGALETNPRAVDNEPLTRNQPAGLGARTAPSAAPHNDEDAARFANMKLPAWFSAFLARYKRSVIVALVLGLVASGCAAFLMFTSGYLISATALPDITLFTIMVPVAFVQLFGLGRPIARYLERLVSHNWVLRVTSDLRGALYRSIARRAGNPLYARASGDYLGILADDIAHLQNLYLRVVLPTATALLLAIGACVVFGVFSILTMLVMIAVFALAALVIPYAARALTRSRTIEAKARKSEEFTQLTDDILGATDWVLAGRGTEAVSVHTGEHANICAIEARVRLIQRSCSLATTLVLGAAICFITAWAGQTFGGYTQTGMEANWIAAFVLGFFPLIEAFSALPSALSQAPSHLDSIARLDEHLSDDREIAVDRSDAAEDDIDGANPSSCITCRDLRYAYPNMAKPALDGVSLDVEADSTLAVLGRSGSGKSTLANIMRGSLKPTSGTCNTAGHVGYLGQSPYLFNRTVRENLTLGIANATDDKLIRALDRVGLGAKFKSLDNGLDTVIGETGIGFSGGEAHRIALARLLVVDDPIVLVDEPFAALDPDTESALLDTLFEVCKDRTLVVITHHLAHIDRFDRIVFLENGRIDLDDSPAELAETSERFRTLIDFDRT